MFAKLNISPKAKKIINIVIDVVAAIILLFAFLLAICAISSKSKGYQDYTEVFGKAYLGVQSDSMEKDYTTEEVKSDNFSKGDLITIKLINGEEAKNLKKDQIITFKDPNIYNDQDKYALNSHRIVDIIENSDGSITYIAHGDNVEPTGNYNDRTRYQKVSSSDVIGVYQGKASGIGHMFLFMGTSAGFFVCVVLPTLLVVVYAAVNLVLVILKEKKVQAVASEEAKLSEREKMRAELLAEMGMNAEGKQEQPETVERENTSEQVETAESENAAKQENVSEQEESSDGAENTK